MPPDRTPAPLAPWRIAAVAAVLVTVTCVVLSVRLDLVAPGTEEFGSASGSALAGLALTAPGALLLWRLGPHPIALVLTGFGVLWSLDGPAAGTVNEALLTGVDSALASWGFWYYVRFGAALVLPIQLILLLFPDGRLVPGRWRPVSIGALVLAAIMPLTYVCAPASVLADGDPMRTETLARFDPGILTLPLPDTVWAALLALAFPATALSTALALAVTISRRRDASVERRAQLRWLIWAGIVFLAMVLASRVLPTLISDIAFGLGIAFVSAAVVIAVTRHRLYAIDGLLGWTIVYVVLLGTIALVDLGLYLVAGSLFDDRVVTLVAVLVVVAVYTPLRDRLHRLVSRWINGTRGDPYEVVSRLAGRLEAAATPEEQLDELVRSLARAFATSFVRVELDRPDGTALAAQTGTPSESVVALPLTYEAREIGRIRMAPGRRPAISARDRRLLGDIVRLAAAALRGADLSRELQSIREGLVAAREEERARLRRELHDGLGPLLGGIRLRLETARNLAERDPERALAVLDTAIEESREVVDEIRRLVHDLRPPALDDLGLARAIDQQAQRLSSATLTIVTDADISRPLSPAVEVAAYRIASEALTNVARHADASRAVVRLRTSATALTVEIEDDGAGIDPTRVAGVGLLSVRERAAELGGTVEFLSGSPEAPGTPGTMVRAILPHRSASPAPVAAPSDAVVPAAVDPTSPSFPRTPNGDRS